VLPLINFLSLALRQAILGWAEFWIWLTPAEFFVYGILGFYGTLFSAFFIVVFLISLGSLFIGQEASLAGLYLFLPMAVVVGIVQSRALLALRYYSQINGGDFDSYYLLFVSRVIFSLVIVGANAWYFLPYGKVPKFVLLRE